MTPIYIIIAEFPMDPLTLWRRKLDGSVCGFETFPRARGQDRSFGPIERGELAVPYFTSKSPCGCLEKTKATQS